MKKLIAILLIAAGSIVAWEGYKRNEALKGQISSSVDKLASNFDGKTRMPEYIWYYVGGGALLLTGLVLFSKGGSSGGAKRPAKKD